MFPLHVPNMFTTNPLVLTNQYIIASIIIINHDIKQTKALEKYSFLYVYRIEF